MPESFSQLLSQGPFLASGIGALVFVYFVIKFIIPVRTLRDSLAGLTKALRDLSAASGGTTVAPQKVAPLFAATPSWQQAWAEFEKSLRLQSDPSGELKSVQTSVAPATIFTRQVLAGAALDAICCKSVPAVLAALGVAGILSGVAGVLMQADEASPGLSRITESGETLCALVMALVPLFLSFAAAGFLRRLPASLPALADDAAQALGGLYKPDETPKEDPAVVLREMLAAQIDRQTAAITASSASISGNIAKSVTESFDKPISQITQAVEKSGRQAENIEKMLQQALASMTTEIAQSIARTFEKPLGQMVRVVEESGKRAENVDRILQDTTAGMIRRIEETFGEQIKSMNALIAENAKSVQEMRQNIVKMMEDLKQNTEYVSGLTRSSVEKMDASAKTILTAAEKFGEAGQVMNAQISHAHSLSRHMMESGAALNGSSQTLAQVVADYGKARDSITALVASLQGIVKDVDQKVTINQSLVSDMQKVADRLKEVQAQTDAYLHQVSGVLSTGFNDFGKSVHDNLEKSTSAFYTSMSNSVELISVQMRNLTSALQDLPEALRKPA
ncbi:MAG: hypothetical protein EPN97_06550 [Alphaproteobacteria bacterium]|nr:MAG: hypothetical protein EPN97_06550 [Alphaproteobacteria bacterium]